MDSRIRAGIRRIRRRQGVIGVFRGHRQKAGSWHDDDVISVHVVRKVHPKSLPASQLLPRKLGKWRIDVIEVGQPLAHVLDIGDELTTDGVFGRRVGTTTAILRGPQTSLVLLSGHVGLPIEQGQLQTSYDQNLQNNKHPVWAVDQNTGQRFIGSLFRGGISPRADWSLAIFPISPANVDTAHPVTGTSPPFQIRGDDVVEGETLHHRSSRRRLTLTGTLRQTAMSLVELRLPDGNHRSYQNLLVVSSPGELFSEPGDSGSLVVDDSARVVGVVLGGSENKRLGYVMPISALRSQLGVFWSRFFSG